VLYTLGALGGPCGGLVEFLFILEPSLLALVPELPSLVLRP
jgi:hypothetical protein